jgi:GT2 family glycosyltransferase
MTVPARISVVVPTYNACGRLRATLAAVLAQTVRPHEIIVVDDGSTDATPSVCAAFGAAIHYLRVENGGQQRARNLGVAQASGAWIALLDHDDLWTPQYIAELMEFHASNDVDLTVCDAAVVTEDATGARRTRTASRLTGMAPSGYWRAMGADPTGRWSVLPRYDYARYLAFHPAQPSVMSIRTSLYRSLGGFDERMRGSAAENFEFELRALRVARVGLIWRPLVTIVDHAAAAGADGAGMAMDLVDCLTFALAHHGLTAAEADAVASERQRRLPPAMAAAFLARRFDRLRRYRRMFLGRPDLKTRIKCALARLPPPAAGLAADLLAGRAPPGP